MMQRVMRDAGRQYSDRVACYAAGRPDYPREAIDLLRDEYNTGPDATIADIGAGTGILSRQLAQAGYRLTTVEPDPLMRLQAERTLAGRACAILGGAAEATGLAGASTDVIAVGQALHWFDVEAARKEFRRIARGPRLLFSIWNDRRRSGSPINEQLHRLLLDRMPAYYKSFDPSLEPAAITLPYSADGHVAVHALRSYQSVDAERLVAWILSVSFAPPPGSAAAADLAGRVTDLAARHARDGIVTIEHDVFVTACRL